MVGPRACGKTTTALRYAKTTVRLDRPSEAVAFRADPDAALRGLAEPVLLDEWQAVPEVLGAVKRAVDTEPRPVVTGLLRADADAVLRDGNLLGRVIETFVVAQLRAEVVIAETRPRLYHLRQEQGRKEIDLLAELGADRIIGIEIKADSAPGKDAANHLAWLRDELGERFVAGVVLHTGPRIYALGERIRAVPICTLWA